MMAITCVTWPFSTVAYEATSVCGLPLQLLFGNRSAAYFFIANYEAALSDALRSIELDPKWVKVRCVVVILLALLHCVTLPGRTCVNVCVQGYLRASQAYAALNDFNSALQQLQIALRLEPGSQLVMKQFLETQKKAQEYDATHPVTSIDHWNDIFMRIGGACFWP